MLIKCHNCNSDYSEYAESCPKCGEKNSHVRNLEKGCYNIINKKKYFTYDPNEKVKRELCIYKIFQICAVVIIIMVIILTYLSL